LLRNVILTHVRKLCEKRPLLRILREFCEQTIDHRAFDFDTRYTNRRVFTQGSACWGLEHRIFTSSPSKLPKSQFWAHTNFYS